MEDGDDDDVGEAQRHRDLHEHRGDTQARALLEASTEFRENFTIFGYNIWRRQSREISMTALLPCSSFSQATMYSADAGICE